MGAFVLLPSLCPRLWNASMRFSPWLSQPSPRQQHGWQHRHGNSLTQQPIVCLGLAARPGGDPALLGTVPLCGVPVLCVRLVAVFTSSARLIFSLL